MTGPGYVEMGMTPLMVSRDCVNFTEGCTCHAVPLAECPDAAAAVTFSAAEICERAGVSYRSLDYWIRRGPFPGTARGSGSKRRFTEAEAGWLAMMARLVRAGLDIEHASLISLSLVNAGQALLAPGLLLTDLSRKEDDQ